MRLHAPNKRLNPRHACFQSPIGFYRAQFWHFGATGPVTKGIPNGCEKILERLFLPIVYKSAVFLAVQILDVVVRSFLASMRPTLLLRDNFDCAFQCASRVPRGVPIPRVAAVYRFLHIDIDVLPKWVGDQRPKWLFDAFFQKFVAGDLNKSIVVIELGTSPSQSLVEFIHKLAKPSI